MECVDDALPSDSLSSSLTATSSEGGQLAWKEFFGSSVSIAPSLMSIYDHAVVDLVVAPGEHGYTGNGSDVCRPHHCNGDFQAISQPSSIDRPPPNGVPTYTHQPHQPHQHLHLQPRAGQSGVGLQEPPRVGSLPGPVLGTARAADSRPQPASAGTDCSSKSDTFCRRPSNGNVSNNGTSGSSSRGRRPVTVCLQEEQRACGSDNDTTVVPSTSPTTAAAVPTTTITTTTSSSPSQICDLQSPSSTASTAAMSDLKKRPLSIRSTSSTTSTASVLAVRRRKKIATDTPIGATSVSPSLAYNGSTHVPPILNELSLRLATGSTTGSSPTTQHPTESEPKRVDSVDDDVIIDCCSDAINEHDQSVSSAESARSTNHVTRVVTELLETERSYVGDINDVIQGYLLNCCVSNDVFTREDVTTLFGNITDIYSFNSGFLSCLTSCQMNPVLIGNCFVEHSQGFNVYLDYCTNYSRSVSVLNKLLQDPLTADLLAQQQMALQHELPLGSFLLKPVQRLFKYQLLLQSMLSQCNGDTATNEALSFALKSMISVARNINQWKREHELALRTVEIQQLLDMTSLGELLLEDKFKLSGAKTNRHLFLFQKGLVIAKRREDGSFHVKASIECTNLMLVETVPKLPLSFDLIPFNNPRMQFTVLARTMEQKRLWCCHIKKLILESYNSTIPDKAKQLALALLDETHRDRVVSESTADMDSVNHAVEPNGTALAAQCPPDRKKAHRKSAGFISDFAAIKTAKGSAIGLQRSESVNSSFRKYEVMMSDCNVADSSGSSSHSHSNQSLQSLRTTWRSSWSNDLSGSSRPTSAVAPTAIAEIVSDDENLEPRTAKSNTLPTAIERTNSTNQKATTAPVMSRVPLSSTVYKKSSGSFDVATSSKYESSMTVTRPMRSTSVERHTPKNGVLLMKHCHSLRPADFSSNNRPFFMKPKIFGVASHIDSVTSPSFEASERTVVVRQQTPSGETVGTKSVEELSSDKKNSTSSLGPSSRCTPPRTTPPRAVAESDFDEDTDAEPAVDALAVSRRHLPSTGSAVAKPSLSRANSNDFDKIIKSLKQRNGVKDDSSIANFDKFNGLRGRTKRSGSYHGLAHHSVTMTDLKSHQSTVTSSKSTVDTLKSALVSFAGKLSGRKLRSTDSKLDAACASTASSSANVAAAAAAAGANDFERSLVSRLLARASGHLPQRRSKSSDRTMTHRVRPLHHVVRLNSNDDSKFVDASLTSRIVSPPDVIRSCQRTTSCVRSKSVDLCDVIDDGGGEFLDDDDDDGAVCQMICGGPSWSDNIDQSETISKGKPSTFRQGVPFIDESDPEE